MPNMSRHVSNQQQVRLQATTEALAFLTQSVSIPAYTSTVFKITDVTGSTGFTGALATFDQYRIDLLETWLVPRDPSGVNETNPGLLTSAIDLDDAATPISIANVQNYASSITSSGACGHYHRWIPHAADDLYNGAFTGFGNVTSPWIDSGSSTVQHFALKAAVTAGSNAAVFDLVTRFTVSFRGLY